MIKKTTKQLQNVCYTALNDRYKKHYHPDNKHHKKHIVADIVLAGIVLALILLSAYIILFYRQAVLHQVIDLKMDLLSETVRSGGTLDLVIVVQNNSGKPLLDTTIEFPSDYEFVLSSVEGKKFEGNTVSVGTLDDGEIEQVRVGGYVISGIDRNLRISAIFHYQSSKILVGSEMLVSESVEVDASTLAIEMDIPENLIANQPFDFTIDYRNDSAITNFDEVSILPNWPPGWEVVESDPVLHEESDFWMIDSIGSLEQGAITGRARILTEDLEIADISVKAFISPFGEPLLQQELAMEVPVKYPNVKASVSADSVVNPGRQIDYVIKLTNQETFPLNNVRARLSINQAVFTAGSYQGKLNEDGKMEVVLADILDTGRDIARQYNLTVRQSINPSTAFGAGSAAITMPVDILYIDNNGQQVTIPLTPAVSAINSDLSVQAFARYYSAEGDQIGRGPIPPVVGETTKYMVFIHLDNRLHSLRDVNLTARLPVGVEWTGRVSATHGGSPSYSPGTGMIHWNVGEIPDYKTNFEQTTFGLAFEIAVTPGPEQEGQNLRLLDEIKVEGYDTVTGHLISDTVDIVTNDLIHDSYAPDSGNVKL